MRLWITIIALVISFGFVMASGCNPSDTSCFLCGGQNGTPCTTNCTGTWSEAAQAYVSCECPQGKACICHCPAAAYNPQTEDKCKGVVCANRCTQGAFSIGTCDPAIGKCKYVQEEVCQHGCDNAGLMCIEGYVVNDDICDYVRGENCVDSKHDCNCTVGSTCKFGDPNADEMGCVPLSPEAANENGKTGCSSSTAIIALFVGTLMAAIRRK